MSVPAHVSVISACAVGALSLTLLAEQVNPSTQQSPSFASPSLQRHRIPEDLQREIEAAPKDIGESVADLWNVNPGSRTRASKRLVAIGNDTVPLLVAVMKDDSYKAVDKNLTKVVMPGHQPMMARYYYVQHEASEALSEITGKQWGFVFNEDGVTWATWLATTERHAFNPAAIQRTPLERRNLIERLIYRYLSGRPNPWQLSNDLSSDEAVTAIASDLQQLRITPDEFQGIARDIWTTTPVWQESLGKWTDRLLTKISPQAKMQN